MEYEVKIFVDDCYVTYCAYNESGELVFTGYSIEDIREFIRREGFHAKG